MKQRSILRPFSLSGIGIHSGSSVKLKFSPSAEDSGIVFIKSGQRIPALSNNVEETRRGTTLGGIAVVEHLLSAIYALGLDNLLVEVLGDEVPILDGSSLPFFDALSSSGITEQDAEKHFLSLPSPIKISEGETSVEALPYHGFQVDFMVKFPVVGEQRYAFDLLKGDFRQEIAPARTFGYIDEYELLKEQGLARGANLENALVIGKDGYLNAPRFPDELVRHKILDLIGDLSLLGRPLHAKITAVKSGHKMNAELVRRILKL